MRFIDPALIPACKPRDWDAKSAQWLARVAAAQDKSAEITKLKNPWKDFKVNFTNTFGDKCWYTEAARVGTTNDVDHFRPKNAVKNQLGKNVARINAAGDVEYASYWWLVYDPLNYRYSCIFSNRANGAGGKQEFFPLEDERTRAWTPTCPYLAEDISFLDPCNFNDVQLIAFDITVGMAVPRFSEQQNPKAFRRFQLSKKYYNLNEKTIVDARTQVLNELNKDLNLLQLTWDFDAVTKASMAQALIDAENSIIKKCERKSPFSAAAVSLVKTKQAEPWMANVLPRLDLTP